jgi:hypothetical protein
VIRSGGTARIWSRQRNDLTDGFRDIAAAAVSQLPSALYWTALSEVCRDV